MKQEVLAQESSFQTTIVVAFPLQWKYANTNMMRNSGTNDDLLNIIDRVQLPKLSIAHQVICWCRICNPAWNRNKKRAAADA